MLIQSKVDLQFGGLIDPTPSLWLFSNWAVLETDLNWRQGKFLFYKNNSNKAPFFVSEHHRYSL